jgi:hypothetical protein
MSRLFHASIGRRALAGAGLLMSAAGMSASVAAQSARTGWEDVKPTGWPSAAPAAAAAPRKTEVASASPAPRASRSASRSSRRRARGAGKTRPAAPAWITLEWDAPPPIDVALDWSPALLAARPVGFVASSPEIAPVRWRYAAADLSDTASLEEARLPVATMIQAAAPAPAAPRPAAFARSASRNASRAPGFRGLMTRVASALGLRRETPVDVAPRVASAEGAATR